MASMAASFRSVLKTLNSVSSAMNAAPVSSVTAVSPLAAVAASASAASAASWPGTRASTACCSNSRSFVKFAITLQRVAEGHDAHQVRRRHLLAADISAAARVERSRSSGCSEVMSKNSTIIR